MSGKNFGVKWNFGAVDNLSSTVDRITQKFKPLTRSAKRATNQFRIMQRDTEKLRKGIGDFGDKMSSVGRKVSLGLTAPVVALEAASVKTFASFEQGVVDVVKTTGLSFKEVEDIVLSLSKKLPVPIDSLNEIAGAAGQLGVKGADNIRIFTETMAKLEKASDVAGEEGAKAIVRLLNVAGDGIPQMEQFSSTLVALGNSSAASESEILHVATRVGQATAQFKLGSKNILGLSAGMKSLGINAEAGGTVVGKAFRGIAEAVDKGGTKMKVLEKITGMTGNQLKETFKEDATSVFASFLKGMQRLEKKGISNTRALEAFGLTGERVNAILPTMVQGLDTVTTSMDTATKAFKENKALNEEFAQQTKTANALFAKFGNIIKRVAIGFGKVLFPAVRAILGVLGDLAEWFDGLSDTTKTVIVVVASLAAAMGPVILALGTVVAIVPSLISGLNALAAAGIISSASFAPLILLMGKFLLLAGLVAFAAVSIYKNWKPIKAFFSDFFTEPLTQIRDLVSWVGQLGGLLPELFGNDIDSRLEKQGFKIQNMEGGAKGKPLDSTNKVIQKNQEAKEREKKAMVGIQFANLPKGARVITDDRGGMLDVDSGMMGAF